MALTAQKLALMVLMLGVMMMGVTAVALAQNGTTENLGHYRQQGYQQERTKLLRMIDSELVEIQGSAVNQDEIFSMDELFIEKRQWRSNGPNTTAPRLRY